MADDEDSFGGFKAPLEREHLHPPKVPLTSASTLGGFTQPPRSVLGLFGNTDGGQDATGLAGKEPQPLSSGLGEPASMPLIDNGLSNPWTDPLDGRLNSSAGLPEYPRSGNYIFTVGRSGSGKSTLQSHLLRYLIQGGEHIVELNAEFAAKTAEFNRILTKWQRNWQVGAFPEATDVNRPREFRYHVRPLQDGLPPLDFGFVEISGEDFRDLQVAAEEGRHPVLDESLNAFLANPDCNISFLFVANGENVGEDDHLFQLFLQYLEGPRFQDRRFRSTCTAILAIANPETAALRLRKYWSESRGVDPDPESVTMVAFAETFLPGASSMLKAWDAKRRGIILPFSVGRLKRVVQDGRSVSLIAEPSFRHSKALYYWLYQHFTGRRLGPGLVHRAWKKFVRQIGGVVEG